MSIDPTQTLIRGLLRRDAARLAVGRALPLDLGALLAEFRIGLEPTTTVRHSPHGHLRRAGGSWRIGVDPEATIARQRFTIAHELGHYLVAARIGYRPGSVREYWSLEAECQAFAAALLSPPDAVAAVLRPPPECASQIAAAIDHLASSTGLALEAAARRIVEALEGPHLVAALEGPGGWPDGKGPARVAWAHATGSWPVVRRGERIRRGHLLADLALTAKTLGVGDAASAAVGLGGDTWIERRGPAFAWLVSRLPATAKAV